MRSLIIAVLPIALIACAGERASGAADSDENLAEVSPFNINAIAFVNLREFSNSG